MRILSCFGLCGCPPASDKENESIALSPLKSPIDEDTPKTNSGNVPIQGYITLIFGMFFQITLGVVWGYGNVSPYIASYLASHSPTMILNGSTYQYFLSVANWCFFVQMTATTVGCLLGGRSEIYFGPKITVLFSSLFVSIGFGATFFCIGNVYLLLLTYGVIFGFGVGLGYPVLIIVSMRWFPNSRAQVCGLISAFFGASPLLWDFIETKIVNPMGITADPYIGYAYSPEMVNQIPYLFLKIACIQLAMQFIGFLAIRNPPWYIPERQQCNETQQASSEQLLYEADSLTVPMSLRTPTFWSLWINNGLFSLCLIFIGTQWKQFAISYLLIDDDAYLAMVGSIAALMNGIGRFMWGFIYDKIRSFRIVMGVMASIVTIGIGTLPLLNVIFMNAALPFAIWVCAIWGCVGCQYGFLPDKISTTFGPKHTGSILGLFIWIESPISLLLAVLTEYYQQIFGGWGGYCMFVAACAIGSLLLSILVRSKINRKRVIQSYGSCDQFDVATDSNVLDPV